MTVLVFSSFSVRKYCHPLHVVIQKSRRIFVNTHHHSIDKIQLKFQAAYQIGPILQNSANWLENIFWASSTDMRLKCLRNPLLYFCIPSTYIHWGFSDPNCSHCRGMWNMDSGQMTICSYSWLFRDFILTLDIYDKVQQITYFCSDRSLWQHSTL